MRTKAFLCLVAAFLLGVALCLFLNRQKTDEAFRTVAETVEKLPAIVPQRVKETHERTVKTHSEVREEAQMLSGDALADALNRELVLFGTAGSGGSAPYIGGGWLGVYP